MKEKEKELVQYAKRFKEEQIVNAQLTPWREKRVLSFMLPIDSQDLKASEQQAFLSNSRHL